ncbi:MULTISPECIES: hypothetical protein [unclassified Pseudomonas]|uniref:hypothetical protein n=1 Tax=unclassified Pseudomonas TaxID=196821 RepID=UPI002449C7A5|nr:MULTISPECIES: hypothetical protein [unclassified Pseudomonas]MDG9926546.1 hypothetical protein [Pseudomonas sp. GD04042]MDH0481370.1 hypothetical protein [Pseudomonas sp. GD04015]MDH0603319.1 hypothetical protein [Pseudomonas sp. GD03869]
MSLAILHHDRATIAIDAEGLINASLLAKHFGRRPDEFLMLNESHLRLAQIAESNGNPLAAQWQDNQLRIHRKPDYLRALDAARIIRSVAGTPGRQVSAALGVAGNGVRDYAPGLWVHAGLAIDLARWLECRGEAWKPSPLAEFIAQALEQHGIGTPAPSDNSTPQSAAACFADTVSATTLRGLNQLDQVLIDGGAPFSERHQTLQAWLEQQAQQEAQQ